MKAGQVGYGCLGVFAIACVSVFLLGVFARKDAPVSAVPELPPPPRARSPVAGKSETELLIDRLLLQTTVADAIAVLKPYMGDYSGNPPDGADLLAGWMAQHPHDVVLRQIQEIPDSKRAAIAKDPDLFRGARVCLQGTVTEIAFRKETRGQYAGSIMTPSYDLVRFISAHPTPGIYEKSVARFCGIAVGVQTHSRIVLLVGTFELNR